MKPIQLNVFHHSDETSTFKDVGMDYKLSDCEVRPIIFYNINAISPYIIDESEHCAIHTNNSEYICVLSFSEVAKLIENNL